MASSPGEGSGGVRLLQSPRWPHPVTTTSTAVGLVLLVAAFLLLILDRNLRWSSLLLVPVALAGLVYGPVPGGLAGFVLPIAAGLSAHAIGLGGFHSPGEPLLAGLGMGTLGGLIGWVSLLYSERRRLLAIVRPAPARQQERDAAIRVGEGQYPDIFQHAAVSLWQEDITDLLAAIGELSKQGISDFRSYLEEHPEFVTSAIQTTKVIDVNEASLKLYGASTKEELLGSLDKTVDLSDPVLIASFRETLVAIASGQRYYTGESTAQTLSGAHLDIIVSSYLSEEVGGRSYMLVSVSNITERIAVQRRVIHLYRLYQVLSEINHLIARVHDREALFQGACRVAVEHGAFRMAWVGLTDEETQVVRPIAAGGFVGSYLERLRVSAADIPEGRGPVGRTIRSHRVTTCGDLWQEPDAALWRDAAKEHGYRSCASAPLFSGEKVTGVFSVYSEEPWYFDDEQIGLIEEIGADLSFALRTLDEEASRRQAEERIREQAQLLDVASDAILVRDLDDRIRFWNRGAERLYGWLAGEALGQEERVLLRFEEAALSEASRALGERGQWSGELHPITRAGERLTVQAGWTLLRDRENRPNGVLVVASDISRQKLAEAQLLRAQRLESLGRLAGAIAHDLNNILTPILAGVESLELAAVPDESRSTVELMKGSVKRGAGLVRQILSFASGGHGRYEEVDLKPLLDEVAGILSSTLLPSVTLEKAVAPDIWTVNGDPTQIHQILMNLGINACDAMEGGGRLRIAARNVPPGESRREGQTGEPPSGHVCIEVVDSGVGMTPKVMERIFDPFFTTKPLGKGTGIGLSTVMALVKSHGGFIEVSSEVGRGSRFAVFLPAAPAGPSPRPRETPGEVPRGRGELILVVDDEEPVRSITERILTAYGFRAECAESGPVAIAIYQRARHEIQAVIVDSRMPGMDGAATIHAIREIDPFARFVLVSGLLTDDQARRAREEGVTAFVAKPFTAESLLRTLARALSPGAPSEG